MESGKAIDRLYEYMRHKGLGITHTERASGLSNGYLGKQKKRGGDLGESALNSILDNCPDLSPEWLLTGRGDMLRPTDHPGDENITPIYKPKSPDKVKDIQYIPYYSFSATAGVFEQYDISEYEIGRIVVPHMPACDGAVSVTGDSMYPLIKSGDIIAYKVLNDISNIHYGDMYLVGLNEGGDTYVAVKWINKHESDPTKAILVSENKHHAPREVNLADIRQIALVKFSIRYNNMG